MSAERGTTREQGRGSDRLQLVLRRGDQITVAALVAVSLALIVLYVGWQRWRGAQLIDVEHGHRPAPVYIVDVNSAQWVELAVLPGIGETLAKAIVEYRDEYGLFSSVDDLIEVPGIGPGRVERLRPYLSPTLERVAERAP